MSKGGSENWKKYVFYLNTDTHVQVRLKLRHDNLKQKQFYKLLMKAYVEDHPIMRELIIELNKEKIGLRSIKKMKKNDRLEKKMEETFNLSDEEIKDIYDQLELDNNNE